jgi:glycosyltransferase involved in cell wall biosynthesis
MRRYAEGLGSLTIVVVAPRSPALRAQWLAANCRVVPTASRRRLLRAVDAMRVGRALARETRPDVVTAQDPFLTGVAGLALSRWLGVPLNVQVHTSFLGDPYWHASGPRHRVLAAVGRVVLRLADTVRVVSAAERDRVLGLGLDAERVWVVPVPVDAGRWLGADGRELRVRVLGDRADRLVLYVGRLAPEKDVATLLEATRVLLDARPSTRVAIVGDGPLEHSLRARVAALGLGDGVLFAGAVPHDVVPSWFAAADVVVLPSLYEGLGLVLVEAALAGKPVVATRTTGAMDVVVDGVTGFLVPQRRPDALAARLLSLLADPARAMAMGSAGRDLVAARFDAEKLYAEVRATWEATAAMRR